MPAKPTPGTGQAVRRARVREQLFADTVIPHFR